MRDEGATRETIERVMFHSVSAIVGVLPLFPEDVPTRNGR